MRNFVPIVSILLLFSFSIICYFVSFNASIKGTEFSFTAVVRKKRVDQSDHSSAEQVRESVLLLLQAELDAPNEQKTAKNNIAENNNAAKQEEPKKDQEQQQQHPMVQTTTTGTNNLEKLSKDGNLHYILGFSAGHTGSITTQQVLKMKGCPWKSTGGFEQREPNEEKTASHLGLDSDRCAYTRDTLLPFLEKKRGNTTYIDAGHFHNRGPVLECLAELLGNRVAFVLIRRNRHGIANSFAKQYRTPCFPTAEDHRKRKTPVVSYCPIEKTTPISLPVDPNTWNKLTTFQQFLWQADDLEMRFHNFQTLYPASHYLEITWSLGEELTKGLQEIRTEFGCENYFEEAPKTNDHTHHGMGSKNCTNVIYQDLEYRRLVQYSDEQNNVLFHQHPQELILNECIETNKQIENLIASLSPEGWKRQWTYK